MTPSKRPTAPRNVRREPAPAESPDPPPAVGADGPKGRADGARNAGGSKAQAKSLAPAAPKQPFFERFPRVFKAVTGVKLLVGILIVVAASLGVAWGARRYMTTSPRFAIKNVAVEGVQRKTPQEIALLGAIVVGDNVFSVDLEQARRKIEDDPWVKTATVTRKLPGTVFVTVVEHEPAALVSIEDKLYLASREGDVFKELGQDDPVDLPVITGIDAKAVASDREGVRKDVQRALDVAAEIERTAIAKRYPLQEIHLVEDGTVEAIVGSDGISLHLGVMPYRGKLEQADRVFAELAKRKAEPTIVFLDNESSPDRVIVRMR